MAFRLQKIKWVNLFTSAETIEALFPTLVYEK